SCNDGVARRGRGPPARRRCSSGRASPRKVPIGKPRPRASRRGGHPAATHRCARDTAFTALARQPPCLAATALVGSRLLIYTLLADGTIGAAGKRGFESCQ